MRVRVRVRVILSAIVPAKLIMIAASSSSSGSSSTGTHRIGPLTPQPRGVGSAPCVRGSSQAVGAVCVCAYVPQSDAAVRQWGRCAYVRMYHSRARGGHGPRARGTLASRTVALASLRIRCLGLRIVVVVLVVVSLQLYSSGAVERLSLFPFAVSTLELILT